MPKPFEHLQAQVPFKHSCYISWDLGIKAETKKADNYGAGL